MSADWLGICKALFRTSLRLLNNRLISLKHVFNVLGLVLGLLLFVRQFDWTSAVEELRGTISRHVLHLHVVHVSSSATSHTSRADPLLQPLVVSEDFVVEESQVVRARPSETLVWVVV